MYRTIVLCLCILLVPINTSLAKERKPAHSKHEAKASKAKELSGMSIVGNDEAPKALYIVPWKSSEIGGETDLHMDLNAADKPVDRDVFMRQLDFYELSTKK